jgi:adenylyltransferase/sulfurtransferase
MNSNDPLIIDDGDRYSRMRLIAWWDQEKIRNAKVLVVGLGALGNEVTKNLVLMGIGDIYAIDLDCVEDSNLTRSVLFRESDNGKSKVDAAARALYDMNQDSRVHPVHGNVMTDIGLGLVRDVDVVIGCLDNREARLWVNRMCWKVGTPWVDGGIQEINGVAKVFVPPDGSCYECAMTENDYRLINLRYSCPLLKREVILEGKVPTAPTISSIIAGLQTQEALKLIHGMEVESGGAMVFNGVANRFYKTKYQHRSDCLSHDVYPQPRGSGLSVEDELSRLFSVAQKELSGHEVVLKLDRDLVTEFFCPKCEVAEPIHQPTQTVDAGLLVCPECNHQRTPKMTHHIESDSPLLQRMIGDCGIARYDIVRFCTEELEVCLELDADRVWNHPYKPSS